MCIHSSDAYYNIEITKIQKQSKGHQLGTVKLPCAHKTEYYANIKKNGVNPYVLI